MPAEAKLQYRTNTRTTGANGGHVSGTDWTNKGEFEFSFWASLYANDAATPLATRAALLAVALAIFTHLKLFGLPMLVSSPGKKSKTEVMFCPARVGEYGDGDVTPRTWCWTAGSRSAPPSPSSTSARSSTVTSRAITTCTPDSRRRP